MQTSIGYTDPQTVKKWAKRGRGIGYAVNKESFFGSKFTGSGESSTLPIQTLDELEKGAGDEVNITLLMPASMEPIVGDESLTGKGEAAKWFVDKLRIEQVRQGGTLGTRMTQKRVEEDIRDAQMKRAEGWWKRAWDEMIFIYASGARGTENKFVWSATNPMFEVNPLTAPDAKHQLFGGIAVSKATLDTSSGMSLAIIDRAVAVAETMGGDGSDEISMVKSDTEGSEHYTCVMHTFQFDELKRRTEVGGWLDIQKANITAMGNKAPIFQGALGMYADVLLYKHRNVVGWKDAGVSANVPMRRALFMGAQAVVVAYGSSAGQKKFKWTEEVTDHGNKLEIGTWGIFGAKKSTYRSKDNLTVRDFGVMALDTYCKDVS